MFLLHDVITKIKYSKFEHCICFFSGQSFSFFILLVGYAGIFHVSEILDIRVKDIAILDDLMKINLIKRKNDQYRQRRAHFSGS